MWIESNHSSDLEKLGHINATLAALDIRDERLMASQPLGHISLMHAGLLTAFRNNFGQLLMAR